jgi:hypothetical protein
MKNARIAMSKTAIKRAAALSSLALMLASCQQLSEGDGLVPPSGTIIPDNRLAADPIAAVGHGAMMGHSGEAIAATPEFVLAAQAFYIARLHGEATEAQRAALVDRFSGYASIRHMTNAARNRANFRLIDWLIAEVKPADAARLVEINAFLRNVMAGDDKRADSDDEISLSRQMLTTTTSSSGQQYINECAADKVPIPPSWGTSSWVNRGRMPFVFISAGMPADVYTFTSSSPRGVCIALPRRSGNTIPLLGIICQGQDTSKACFWDNKHTGNPPPTITDGQVVPLSTFLGGGDLVGNGGGTCTDCHAGENPYIVHPGTPLDLGPSLLRANSWVNPLVSPAWPQNRRPGRDLDVVALVQPPDGSCLTCHNKNLGNRFPKLDTRLPGYCGTIAAQAMTRTMPPGAVGSAAYQKHRDAFTAACNQAPKAPSTHFGPAHQWSGFFAPNPEYPLTGDFNGDGRGDVVTFVRGNTNDVYVALSNGSQFGSPQFWNDFFGLVGEIPQVGDFNGDGKDDILAFTMNPNNHVFVGLSNGSSFASSQLWHGLFGLNGEVPMVGDFNNDGKDDIISFTKSVNNNTVWVALSNGSQFGTATQWSSFFAPGTEVPLVGDFNGDGFDDIIAFTRGSTADVFVALSNGTTFDAPSKWSDFFVQNAEIPRVGDVNGDGLDDIITFVGGQNGDVFVALSNGSSFGGPIKWHEFFGVGTEVPNVTDLDADGRTDLVTFVQAEAKVWTALSLP